jgi:hypothetical protein
MIGGLLTLISNLLVEKYRDRTHYQREFLDRRRSGLEELERSITDAHAKLLSTANVIPMLARNRDTDRDAAWDERSMEPLDRPRAEVDADPLGPVRLRAGNRGQERQQSDELLLKILFENTGKVEILHAIGLAARTGTPEIRKGVSDYASAQLEWAKATSSSQSVLQQMELQIRNILQLIAAELRDLDDKGLHGIVN